MTAGNEFGKFAKEKRLSLGVSLRQFCRNNGLDWGNISRIERGVSPPPKSREVQERYARALQMEEGSEDWQTFLDLADICAGNIPQRVMSDEELVAKLPMVFRTIGGKALTPEKLRELTEMIRKA
ncbi:MAG TPA: helix-turn-helix transcriptional regulator [Planctomycetota bacterium]|nr:helix-turn-helix transcriptional regulator [Planctomycetota bacterium]